MLSSTYLLLDGWRIGLNIAVIFVDGLVADDPLTFFDLLKGDFLIMSLGL